MSAEDLPGSVPPLADSGWYDDLYRSPSGGVALGEWFPRKVLSFQTRYRVVRSDGKVRVRAFMTEGEDLRSHRRAFTQFLASGAKEAFPGAKLEPICELPVRVQGVDGQARLVVNGEGLTAFVESLPLPTGLGFGYRTPYTIIIGERRLPAHFDSASASKADHQRAFEVGVGHMVAGPRVVEVRPPILIWAQNERGQRLKLLDPIPSPVRILQFFGFL
jgi:hypothetical protein